MEWITVISSYSSVQFARKCPRFLTNTADQVSLLPPYLSLSGHME